MAQYRVSNGQYRNRAKTYAKRTAGVLGGYLGLNAVLLGSRRGRRLVARTIATQRRSGSSAIAKALTAKLKASAGFRRRVRSTPIFAFDAARRIAGHVAARIIR